MQFPVVTSLADHEAVFGLAVVRVAVEVVKVGTERRVAELANWEFCFEQFP